MAAPRRPRRRSPGARNSGSGAGGGRTFAVACVRKVQHVRVGGLGGGRGPAPRRLAMESSRMGLSQGRPGAELAQVDPNQPGAPYRSGDGSLSYPQDEPPGAVK